MGSTPSPDNGSRKRSFLGYPRSTLLILVWLLLSYVGYVAFTRDQARSGVWGCEMAYMYPNYQRLEWDGSNDERYSVYLYREGGADPTTPIGRPVIFLPGNSGSFMQARSIASSAAHQFFDGNQDGHWAQPLDFFAVDYNEDFSALHAPTLEDQARFVASVTPHILESYRHLPPNERPTHVTLVGHSMGGIVARLASLYMPNNTIDAIVTMSTPHNFPPLPFEGKMDELYAKINSASHLPPHPLLISICGGISDTQIVSDSCAFPQHLAGPDDGFTVFSTGIPGVWTGVEHQAMVWCDQVRWRVARALLDMGDASSREAKLASAREWLVGPQDALIASSSSGQQVVKIDITSSSMALMLHLPDMEESTIARPPIHLQICDKQGICRRGEADLRAIPSPRNPDDPFPFPGEGIPARDAVFVVDAKHLPLDGLLQLEIPRGARYVAGGLIKQDVASSTWNAPVTAAQPVHWSLRFPRRGSSIISWRMEVKTGQCTGPPPVVQHVSRPATGYGNSFESTFYPHAWKVPVTLHSHISGAPFQSDTATTGIDIEVYQQPECTVTEIRVSLDILATIAKAMLRFRIAAVTWCLGWVALLVLYQLGQYKASTLLDDRASANVLPPIRLLVEQSAARILAPVGAMLLVAPLLQAVLGPLGLAPQDYFLGLSTELSHILLSLMIAFWSFGLVLVIERVMAASVSICGRVIGKEHQESSQSKTWLTASRAIPTAILLVLVKTLIPWRMAFVVLYLIQFAVVARSSREEQKSRYNILLTTLLLLTFLLPLTVPSIAVWGRNLWMKHGHPFESDHEILPLLPVLLLVQLSSSDFQLSRNKHVIQLAQFSAALLAIVAFSMSARRSYLLLMATNVLFLALSAMISPPFRMKGVEKQ